MTTSTSILQSANAATGIEIRPLKPAIGARVTGFSIRDGVDDALLDVIAEAVDLHSVLHLPDQPLDDAAQIAFSERLGPLESTVAGALSAGERITRVSNVHRDGRLKDPNGHLALFTRANGLWHTDSSYKPVPARWSILSARETPPEGGDTEFASTRAAYEALDDATRERVEGLLGVHDLAHSRLAVSPAAITDAQRAANPPVEQALVRTNPRTGRRSLTIGSHLVRFLGMDEEASKALHERLLALATRPEHRYRHRWRPGDVVIWDNRAVVHRGHPYDEVRHRRVMMRTTIAGAGPTALDGVAVPGA